MNKFLKYSFITLSILSLCACAKNDTNEIETNESKYSSGYSLSLGYGLPSITFADDYEEWALNDDYFGGKKVDEAYTPKYDKTKDKIVVYRNLIEEDLSLSDFANNSIINNAYDKTQNVSLQYYEEDIPYAYYSVVKDIDNNKYLAQEYFYLGSNEYVNLEYLTPMLEEKIADSELYIYIPTTYYSNNAEGYIASYAEENKILPSIYISREAIESEYIVEEQGEYITPTAEEIDFDEFNYEDYLKQEQEITISSNDYHQELTNYLNNMYTLFDIEDIKYSNLLYQNNEIETLILKYPYIENDIRYQAYELNIGIDQYLYSICFCSFDDSEMQKANAQLIFNTICFK